MKYAAYGSNLHPIYLKKRISSARLIGTGFLPDRSLRFHKRSVDGSGKCNIFSGDSGVYIAIFDISIMDKGVLDEIEGLGSGYSEVLLSVPGFGDCYSYVAKESHIDDALVPFDWYKELVLVGAREHRFPEEYLNEIDAIAACPDSDSSRREEKWQIMNMLKTGDQQSADI